MMQGPSNHPIRTRIKICGINSREMAEVAIDAGADAIGFMFVPNSPRYVHVEKVGEIVSPFTPFVQTVGVFQNPTRNQYSLGACGCDWIQLHGDEDEELIRHISEDNDCFIIKGFRFNPDEVKRWDANEHVHALLIDGSAGGEGKVFEHEHLAEMMHDISKPVILAGGLNAENVGAAIQCVRPYAVDVSSGVELARGRKGKQLIHNFCAAVRAADEP